MKMLSLDTRNNQQKSIIISKRLRKLGLQPIHEYEKNLPNNSFFSARLWLKLKNADFSFEEGRFFVNSVDIEVQARETVREHGDIFIDKPVQNVNSGAFTFAVNFTRLYDEIAEEFPVFHKLKQVCKAIVLARHIKERNIPVDVTKILDCINWKLNKPESITEIMNKHEKTLGNIKSTLTVSGGVDLSTNDLLFNLLSFQEETKEIFQVRKSHFNHSRIDINQGHFIFQLEKFCVECKTIINPKLLHIYIAQSISEYRFLCKYHSDFTCKKCFDVLEGSFCIINGISVHKNCLNCYFCGGLINDQYVEYSNNIFHPECRFPTTPTLHEYDEIDDFMIEDSLMQNILFESWVDRINQRRDFK